MQFEPVWISSVEHLTQFDDLYARTHPLPRAVGAIRFPTDFPRMELIRLMGHQLAFPIVMVSEGALEIGEDYLRYRAYDAARLATTQAGKAMLHLRTDWQFELKRSEITRVEPRPWSSPVLRYYDMPWTHIESRHSDDLAGDFLICAGGRGALMGKIKQRSAQLASELQNLKSA